MNARILPYVLILPVTLFLCLFFLYPFVLVAQQAFTTGAGFTLDNFREVVSYWKFPISMKNTLLAGGGRRAGTAGPVAADGDDGQPDAEGPRYGPLHLDDPAGHLRPCRRDHLAGDLRTVRIPQFDDERARRGRQACQLAVLPELPGIIFLAIALAEIWRATAIMLVILVAGIGLIPKEYYEAADVFGASKWKQFLRITLPMLRPSLQTALVLRVILAFEIFAVVAALGGTLFPVLMGETYAYQFDLLNSGAAAAMALIILAISIGFTLIILRVLRVPKGASI